MLEERQEYLERNLNAYIQESKKEKTPDEKKMDLMVIQIEQMKLDNVYLLSLLRKTKKFEPLVQYIEDSGGKASIMKPLEEPKDFNDNCYPIVTEEDLGDGNFPDELIPTEAVDMANQFRLKNGNDLTQELISQLLVNLNLVWRKREKRQIMRLEKRLRTEITQLKRQMYARQPHDTVRLNKRVSKLNLELSHTKTDLSKAQAKLDKEKE